MSTTISLRLPLAWGIKFLYFLLASSQAEKPARSSSNSENPNIFDFKKEEIAKFIVFWENGKTNQRKHIRLKGEQTRKLFLKQRPLCFKVPKTEKVTAFWKK
jgi:hypothetical protein